MGHNIVTADTVDPIVCHLHTLGFNLGYDYVASILAASAAAKELEALDFDTDALVARYHELAHTMTGETA